MTYKFKFQVTKNNTAPAANDGRIAILIEPYTEAYSLGQSFTVTQVENLLGATDPVFLNIVADLDIEAGNSGKPFFEKTLDDRAFVQWVNAYFPNNPYSSYLPESLIK